MALGYTIATILKRKSHIFDDDKVIVKTDWLEQLNRTYVQVRSASLMSLKTYILSLEWYFDINDQVCPTLF
jgi:hypothetical protein